MVRYDPNRRAIVELMGSPMVQNAVRGYAEVLLDLAKAEAPVDEAGPHPGRLRASGHLNDTAEGTEVLFDAPYAAAVHNGYKPHRIHAKAGKVLHWKDASGRDHFAKYVDHPGFTGDAFLQRAVDIMAAI